MSKVTVHYYDRTSYTLTNHSLYDCYWDKGILILYDHTHHPDQPTKVVKSLKGVLYVESRSMEWGVYQVHTRPALKNNPKGVSVNTDVLTSRQRSRANRGINDE